MMLKKSREKESGLRELEEQQASEIAIQLEDLKTTYERLVSKCAKHN